ncbi:MAG: DNA mismatch repair endonuclease MutL [Peptococcaceae bacterium]|nr:DNA mismatch repair endonuclease MutL [Peptococcaceae bacterium]
MKINVLSSEVVNQIAAGEVVERPASAIKELVENSLDSGATSISVDLEGGGMTLIRVTDNGCGMGQKDLELSILRHATSKLKAIDDLFSIGTLGFRGEALPSIAAVSKLRIQSKEPADNAGHELICSGGEILELKPVGMPQGTIVEVRGLFFNTPARLKFMKSETAESQRVVQVIERLAFSHPSVRFTLTIDSRIVLQTLGNNNLIDTALAVFGASAAKQLRSFGPVQGKTVGLSGILGTPALHRNNRTWQTLFLNGRYIEHRGLAFALEEAYRTLLPIKRYPVGVIHITMNPQEVDVNVHPTKVEVRLQDERAVVGEVITMLRAQVELMTQAKEQIAVSCETAADYSFKSGGSTIGPLLPAMRFEDPAPMPKRDSYGGERPVAPAIREQISILPAIASYRLIGQVLHSYILVEKKGKLVIIDQHAAHERILFEQFIRSIEGYVQELAIPISVDFGSYAHFVPRFLEPLNELGFRLEPFGGNTYLLRSIPATYRGHFDEQTLRDLMSELSTERTSSVWEKVAISLACRSAIKANTRLSASEMVELLDQLYACALPVTCPHGRPIELEYSEDELFKLFHPR